MRALRSSPLPSLEGRIKILSVYEISLSSVGSRLAHPLRSANRPRKRVKHFPTWNLRNGNHSRRRKEKVLLLIYVWGINLAITSELWRHSRSGNQTFCEIFVRYWELLRTFMMKASCVLWDYIFESKSQLARPEISNIKLHGDANAFELHFWAFLMQILDQLDWTSLEKQSPNWVLIIIKISREFQSLKLPLLPKTCKDNIPLHFRNTLPKISLHLQHVLLSSSHISSGKSPNAT